MKTVTKTAAIAALMYATGAMAFMQPSDPVPEANANAQAVAAAQSNAAAIAAQQQGQMQGQAQGQQQGQAIVGSGNSSAAGGSVFGSGNSTATGGQGGAGGQGGTATGGSATGGSATGGAGGSASLNNSGNASSSSSSAGGTANISGSGNGGVANVTVGGDHYEAPRIPVASAWAAPLTTSNGTCMGSSSAGGQGMSFGISFGSTWTDDDCDRRYDAQELRSQGLTKAATALMCQKESVRKAMKDAGTPCPQDQEQAKAQAPTPADPKRVAVGYTGDDPIVMQRLGLR